MPRKATYFYKRALYISLFAAALLITSIATPLWIWLEHSGDHIGISLFYRTGLKDDQLLAVAEVFKKVKFQSEQTLDCRHWSAMAAMEVISTAFAILLLPMLFSYIEKVRIGKTSKTRYKYLLTNSAAALGFNMVGLLLFIIYHGDVLTEGPHISGDSFSWAAFMSFIALLCHIVVTYLIYREKQKASLLDSAVPVMADPRSAIYPRLNDAMMTRSFRSMPTFLHRAGMEGNDFFNGHLKNQRQEIMSAGDLNERRDWVYNRAKPLELAQPRAYALRKSFSDGRLLGDDGYRRQSDFQHGLIGIARGEITNSAYRKYNEQTVNPAYVSDEPAAPRTNEAYMMLERRARENTMNDITDEEYVYNRAAKPAFIPKPQLGRALSQSYRSHVY